MKDKDYSKKISVILPESVLVEIESIAEKYGLTQSGAIRFLTMEGIAALKEQGRL